MAVRRAPLRSMRRTITVLSVIVLSIALTLTDAADGSVALSVFGNAGTVLVLTLHWRLTRQRRAISWSTVPEPDAAVHPRARAAG